MTSFRTCTIASALTLGLAGCTTRDFDDGPEDDPMVDETDDTGGDGDAEEDGETGEGEGEADGEDDGGYVIRGGMGAAPSGSLRELGLAGPAAGNCPFMGPNAHEVCEHPDCMDDPHGDACRDAVEEYCEHHPDDPGCEWDPGDGDHGPPEPDQVLSPTSLWIKAYAVELSADAEGCSDPVLVAETPDPAYVDVGSAPDLFDGVSPPDDIYPCVIVTMSDHIKWEVDEDVCGGGAHTQDVYSPGDHGPDGVEDTIRIYMSTSGSSDEDSDAFSPPGMKLEAPHVAGTDVVESTFYVYAADTVWVLEHGFDGQSDPVCEMMQPSFGFVTEYAP